jgi:hypothetical protein
MHPKIRLGEIDPSENLGVLLIEFFEFYGQYFNYFDCGICILNGGSYYRKAQRGWTDLRQPYLMSMEDPTDPSSPGLFKVMSWADIVLKQTILHEDHFKCDLYGKRLQALDSFWLVACYNYENDAKHYILVDTCVCDQKVIRNGLIVHWEL